MKKLEDLKPGDKITIEYADVFMKAKVVKNLPKARKIALRICFIWPFGMEIIRGYGDYNFADFNELNP